MTPLQIQMMLHYYAIVTPYARNEPAHAGSPAVFSQRNALVRMGLLEQTLTRESGYMPTKRGLRYVTALKAMPIPD